MAPVPWEIPGGGDKFDLSSQIDINENGMVSKTPGTHSVHSGVGGSGSAQGAESLFLFSMLAVGSSG